MKYDYIVLGAGSAGSIIATIALALFTTLNNGLSTESAIVLHILKGGNGIF